MIAHFSVHLPSETFCCIRGMYDTKAPGTTMYLTEILTDEGTPLQPPLKEYLTPANLRDLERKLGIPPHTLVLSKLSGI